MRPVRILGLDPGSQQVGWGVIDRQGAKVSYVAAGVIRLPPSGGFDTRLKALFEEVQTLVKTYQPEVTAIEDVFHAKFARSALKLGHARGVILVAIKLANIDVCSYPPALVKKAVTGSGKADKAQVARFMAALLGIPKLPTFDATDALAIALTHARSSSKLCR